MQAKDVMTVNVISVREDAPIHEVVTLLLKHRISRLLKKSLAFGDEA
jgi:CBS domain-containing protein